MLRFILIPYGIRKGTLHLNYFLTNLRPVLVTVGMFLLLILRYVQILHLVFKIICSLLKWGVFYHLPSEKLVLFLRVASWKLVFYLSELMSSEIPALHLKQGSPILTMTNTFQRDFPALWQRAEKYNQCQKSKIKMFFFSSEDTPVRKLCFKYRLETCYAF